MKSFKTLRLLGLSGLCLLSFVRYFDNIDYWIVDILSHFPVQYAFLALIFMFIYTWKKNIPLAVFGSFLFVVNAIAVVDFGESIHAAEQAGKTFKIYSANIYIDNKELLKLNYVLQEIDPEIVLLLEVTPEHVEQMHVIMQTYPYSIENTSIGSFESGLVFLSKFPIMNYHVTKLSERGNLILEATLEINREPVIFYGVHALRPSIRNFNDRRSQFLRLARQINEHSSPVIVAGDLNLSPFSSIFRRLLEISGLRDSRAGFGWQPSWPTYFPFLWIPIDHLLVSPEIQVLNRVSGAYIGSDHYPVIAELSINL